MSCDVSILHDDVPHRTFWPYSTGSERVQIFVLNRKNFCVPSARSSESFSTFTITISIHGSFSPRRALCHGHETAHAATHTRRHIHTM